MTIAEGGCLCSKIRYQVSAPPTHLTVCHCKFCQRATGGAYMVEPIFAKSNLSILEGTLRTYAHVSEGSGKSVFVHFCEDCGTKIHLSFERFPDAVGIYAGTFDDPNWYNVAPDETKHIFLGVAQKGTIIPAGVKTYERHARTNDEVPEISHVFEHPHAISMFPH
ncbi:GFA family protein [Roseovarius sp. EL26]|uniref:GFA family protein n=1 Tax=Roseovarius sp. EL26 TaxID=2126672 RepID=UPI000EA18C0C|nr:GFA family protein [Roseovarius sp. EL26]